MEEGTSIVTVDGPHLFSRHRIRKESSTVLDALPLNTIDKSFIVIERRAREEPHRRGVQVPVRAPDRMRLEDDGQHRRVAVRLEL